MSDIAISVKNVFKSFKLPHEKHSGLKQAVINFRPGKKYEVQSVLQDISFDIKKGEFFGIVGRNGSGKSTLLKLLAQIYEPDNGAILVNGSLTPFIELGVGFNPELTGRENVFLNGALLGFDRKQIAAMYDEIVAFAELEKFMDQKLKNYSSGMQVRLAFSIAVRAKSDILLIDEVLAVGDSAFQRKCYDHFMHMKKQKKTVVLVTHDMGAVRQYCDRAIMIESGQIVKAGIPEVVAQAYQKLFIEEIEQEDQTKDKSHLDRWGTGRLRADRPSVVVDKDTVIIKCRFVAQTNLPAPVLGITIFGPSGANIVEANTLRQKFKTKDMSKGQAVEITWNVPNIFASGRYNISVACCDQSTTEFYDWINQANSFNVSKDSVTTSAVDPFITINNYGIL